MANDVHKELHSMNRLPCSHSAEVVRLLPTSNSYKVHLYTSNIVIYLLKIIWGR